VRKLRAALPERIWRMECQPGEEQQVDFGLGAPIDSGQNKKRRSWVFRLVLSYSRKGYSEAVIRQDAETFIRCLENGLRSLGGSPLVPASVAGTDRELCGGPFMATAAADSSKRFSLGVPMGYGRLL
jgi:hypothetical protein